MEHESQADDAFSLPTLSRSSRLQQEAKAGKRPIALLFFWISLFVFVATLFGAGLRFRELSTWGTGGEGGFVVLGEYITLWLLTLLGLGISLVFCIISIPHFKGAIILLLVELLPFALLCFGTISVSKPGP